MTTVTADDSATERPLLWLRAEEKPGEARTAVVPTSAARLIDAGFRVVVEASPERAFRIEDYTAVGCDLATGGAWRENAPDDAIVIGLKELDPSRGPFRHRHVHFAHAFKEQRGWRDMLRAFADGGGILYDLEYLVDDVGRRVAAFGERAGFTGAALGLLAFAGQRMGQVPPLGALAPWESGAGLVAEVRAAMLAAANPVGGSGGASGNRSGGGSGDGSGSGSGGSVEPVAPRVLVIGAHGRSGQGAMALCEACGLEATAWDIAETAPGGPFTAVRDHDVVISCVYVDAPLPPFTTRADLERPGRRLGVIVDVGCDPFGQYNPLPLYDVPTSLTAPTCRLLDGTPGDDGHRSGGPSLGRLLDPPLDLIAIDHLPSLLPVESSEEFSARLLPHLLALDRTEEGVWARAAAVFEARLGDV